MTGITIEGYSMSLLANEDVLFHQGSLLTPDGQVVASYDIEQQQFTGPYFSLYGEDSIRNAAVRAFRLDYRAASVVQVINGMGVALGDSIIGLTAIEALREFNPDLHAIIYRPAKAPGYVDELYHLAAGIIAEIRWLPWRLANLTEPQPIIDLGNHLFWPAFANMPMIDFFLWALGVDPNLISPELKANRWLERLCLPVISAPGPGKDYVLFCHKASTPIRSIPQAMHLTLVEWLWQRFHCPVLGFTPVEHPHYQDISRFTTDTAHFLSWFKHARYVLTSDSAAVHIAAGFNVPSLAIFTSIKPERRVRDYPLCQPLRLEIPALDNMHASARPQDIALVEQAYQQLDLSRAC
jgi:hypothetical protein